MTWHASAALAKRIEQADAANSAACAHEQDGFAVEWFGSGRAIFAGPDSPLTQAIGIGMDGPTGAGVVSRIEEFFVSRGAMPVMDLCPHADPGLVECLGQRGYQITEFSNVMWRPVDGPAAAPAEGSDIRLAAPGDEKSWSRLLAQGFLERDDVTAAELLVGHALFRAPGAVPFWTFIDGEPAAGGAASAHGGVAMLYADSTRRSSRRRGAQLAVIAARLEWARTAGCDLAAASVAPGSASQRNYERSGFRVAYTRVALRARAPA